MKTIEDCDVLWAHWCYQYADNWSAKLSDDLTILLHKREGLIKEWEAKHGKKYPHLNRRFELYEKKVQESCDRQIAKNLTFDKENMKRVCEGDIARRTYAYK